VSPAGACGLESASGVGLARIDLGDLAGQRRVLVRPCLDWSERQRHVAGAFGAALAGRLFELRWLRRRKENRSVEITALGREKLLAELGVKLDA